MIAQILLALGLAYQTWSLVAMEMNYRRAASMGIPLVRLPIDPENIIWLVLEPHLWRLLDHLPFSWGTFGRYSRRGWHFKDKASSHLRYGPAWALVTPAFVYIYIADPDAVHDIFVRRGDFLRPSKMYSMWSEGPVPGSGLIELQSYWRCTDRVSRPRVGQTGHDTERYSRLHSTRILWNLSGTNPSIKHAKC